MSDTSNTLLAVISASPLSGHHLYEALSALMVLATYGQAVQLLFVGDAVQSLQPLSNVADNPTDHRTATPFKSVQAMIESFEFYDLLPVWVAGQPVPASTVVECVAVALDQVRTDQFKAVLTW
ncbi:MAG: DsrE family protein [Moraxellaceae bacterium]